ncbi:MAG: hypothetical protein Q8K96_02535 [Rubrivivax sp.]|nr:hypothetical protein [Rubrivivax sp.]
MIFSAPESCRQRATANGRPVPAAEVSCLAAQRGCQLCGGEIARPAVAGRPICDLRGDDFVAEKLSFSGEKDPGMNPTLILLDCGHPMHELQRRHHQVRGAVAPRHAID